MISVSKGCFFSDSLCSKVSHSTSDSLTPCERPDSDSGKLLLDCAKSRRFYFSEWIKVGQGSRIGALGCRNGGLGWGRGEASLVPSQDTGASTLPGSGLMWSCTES